MELVQQGFQLRCAGQNLAVNVCSTKACTYVALMCQNEECRCQNLHMNCVSIQPLKRLKQHLQKKGQSYESVVYQIYRFYNNKHKLILVQMERLNKIVEQKEWFLDENEKLLYLMLKDQKHNLIFPELVVDVVLSLQKQNKNDVLQTLEKTQKQIDKSGEDFDKMLCEIRKLTEIVIYQPALLLKQQFNFRFDSTLHNQLIEIVNNKIAQLHNSSPDNYRIALVKPSLLDNQCKTHKIAFKINKITWGDLMFGVCQLTPNFCVNNLGIHNQFQIGSFTGCNNSIYIGTRKGHRVECTSINKFDINDVVQIEYDGQSQKVTVANVTKNMRSVTYIKADNNFPLHFAVMLIFDGDEVEIFERKSSINNEN